MLRPRLKLPIPIALSVVLVAYLLRSLVLRHGSFTVDVGDGVLLGMLVVGLLGVGLVRARQRRDAGEGRATEDPDNERH